MTGLTDRQREILKAIRQFVQDRGYPPTLRELGKCFGIRSTNGVNDHLRALERKGYIMRRDMLSRGITLTALSDLEMGAAMAGVAAPMSLVNAVARASLQYWRSGDLEDHEAWEVACQKLWDSMQEKAA